MAGYLVAFISFRAHTLLPRVYLQPSIDFPALLATSEYNVYYILPALTATSENYLYCIPLFSAPVRALPPSRPKSRTNADPLNPHDEQHDSHSSSAVALGDTDTVTDIDALFK